MIKHNLYIGKYTLSRNFILREGFGKYYVSDIRNDSRTLISYQFYTVLRLFTYNCTNLSELDNYFSSNGIKVNMSDIQGIINNRTEFNDIFVESHTSLEKVDTYKKNKIKENLLYEPTPETIDFLITNKCNLTCPHCNRNSSSNDKLDKISVNRIFELFDEMEELRVCSIKITGGEPFLVPELYEILSYAITKRIHVTVLTNATVSLDKKWNKILSSSNIALGISLDGAKSITNDKIRGKGSFDKTMDNLIKFSKLGIYFTLTFTVTKNNYRDMEGVINLAIKLKARNLYFNFIENMGRAVHSIELFNFNDWNIIKIKKDIELFIDRYKRKIEISILDDSNDSVSSESVICNAGTKLFAIDSMLNVYPCIYGIGGKQEYPVGSLMESNIIDIWNSNEFSIFRGGLTINDLPKCSKCEYKSNCNLKSCRLRPLYEGRSLTDNVSFCKKEAYVY